MTTVNEDTTQPTVTQPLPEYWPEEQRPQPERVYWLPWPMAVLLVPLLWLMPKRMGPHFAAVRWPGVIVGHLFWTIYGYGCVSIAFDAPKYSWVAYLAGRSPGQSEPSIWLAPTVSEIFRSPLALLAMQLAEVLKGIEELIIGLGIFAGVELAFILLAIVLLPYAAVGERAKHLFARCVKLTLWAPSSLVVFGLLLQTRIFFVPEEDLGDWERTIEMTLPFYLAWVVWILIRSSLRYAGPAKGPAWEPQQPQCEKCGYLLVGLTTNDKCPECGCPVADSMPERREAPAFVAGRGVFGKASGFLKTSLRVVFDRRVYETTHVRDVHADARRFAIASYIAAPPILTVVLVLVTRLFEGYRPLLTLVDWIEVFGVAPIYMSLIFLLVSGIVGVIAMASRGSGSAQSRLAVVFFHSAWLLPVILSIIAMSTLFAWLEVDEWIERLLPHTQAGQMWMVSLSIIVGLLMIGPVPILAFFRFTRGLRQIRFANA